MIKPSRPEVFFGGAAIACVVACVGVLLWKKWPQAATLGTKGEWVGALATLAAALTAVAIAFWSQRSNKIDSMMEGAFEIVAGEYVVRQIKGHANAFRFEVTKYIEQLAQFDSQISRAEQQKSAAQSVNVAAYPDAASQIDRIVGAERMLEKLEYEKANFLTERVKVFAVNVETLQTQTAALSHVKMAAFDPAIGLAAVKAKALLRRSEALIHLGATSPALLDCITEVIGHLAVVEAGVAAAERHIKRMGENH